jgi:alpha-mannosidase
VTLPPGAEGRALVTGGAPQPVQAIHRADGTREVAAPVIGLPSLGWTGAALVEAGPAAPDVLSASPEHLENEHLRVAFDAQGEIASIRVKATGREAVAPGQTANRLIAYEDKPMSWDAWDIDWYFEEQSWPLSDAAVEVVETGPHRAALRIERRYQSSRVVQVVSLAAGAKQVEFDTFIDWQERQTVLKAAFPFDMNVSEVRSEIQFGHVRRPTHRNTSWDRARFEASMHRWVDLSEPDFGAALLNDGKYAYDAVEQLVRLTLVRGSIHPDPDADRGEHRLRYALLLHGGTADLETVHHAAEAFNNPVLLVGDAMDGADPGAPFSFAQTDAPNVAIETLKRAEAGEGLVLRLFEHANRRAPCRSASACPCASVARRQLSWRSGGAVEHCGWRTTPCAAGAQACEIATLLIETN